MRKNRPPLPHGRGSDSTALTRAFRETVYARARRDGEFREALRAEAVNACLSGDEATGKAILRDVINAAAFRQPAEEP